MINILFSENQSNDYIENTLSLLDYMIGDSHNIHSVSDELSKEFKYVHILRVLGYPSHDIKSKDLTIDQSILNKYKEGYDIKFLFITLHESDAPDAPEVIIDYTEKLGIKNKSVYFCSGNEMLDINSYSISTHTNNIIPRVISHSMYLNGQHEFSLERDKLFQSYNRAPKQHRVALATFLHKEGLLNKTDLSLRCSDEIFRFILEDKNFEYNFSSTLDSKEYESFNESLKLLCNKDEKIISEYEKFEFDKHGPQHDLTYKNNLYKHSYINIVTETQYEWDGIIHITEKSLQPLWFYQLPIIVASPHHIKRMRETYDFDWFDDFINHSYDSQENHVLRFHKIRREILRLSKMESEVKQFFKDNQKRFEYNRSVIEKIRNSDKDFNFFQKIIK